MEHPGCGGSDAKATNTRAVIWGWWSEVPIPVKSDVQWFSVDIKQRRFPWAFAKGSPQRCISALELLGTVILLKLATRNKPNSSVQVAVKGITDSQCNTFAMLRCYIRKMPAAGVHMELTAVLSSTNSLLRISHRMRDLNTWADQLTEEDFIGFSAGCRWEPVLDRKFFEFLDDVLK